MKRNLEWCHTSKDLSYFWNKSNFLKTGGKIVTKMLQKGIGSDVTHRKIFPAFKILVRFLEQVGKMWLKCYKNVLVAMSHIERPFLLLKFYYMF